MTEDTTHYCPVLSLSSWIPELTGAEREQTNERSTKRSNENLSDVSVVRVAVTSEESDSLTKAYAGQFLGTSANMPPEEIIPQPSSVSLDGFGFHTVVGEAALYQGQEGRSDTDPLPAVTCDVSEYFSTGATNITVSGELPVSHDPCPAALKWPLSCLPERPSNHFSTCGLRIHHVCASTSDARAPYVPYGRSTREYGLLTGGEMDTGWGNGYRPANLILSYPHQKICLEITCRPHSYTLRNRASDVRRRHSFPTFSEET
ncbi:hypothetical protein Bbelb_214590 [Branchiostoma belcheri]|nr:hypothetical protein Bbelb_214590 [Branchiostoma belcheri]